MKLAQDYYNGNKKWIQNVGEESQEVRLEDNIRIYKYNYK
jgi:hypothetical protein